MRSMPATSRSGLAGSGTNSFTPKCIASISSPASTAWLLMTKKLMSGNWRMSGPTWRSDSIAVGSRLTMTSFGASARRKSCGSASSDGISATMVTPCSLRKVAISCRLAGSASMMTQFSSMYTANVLARNTRARGHAPQSPRLRRGSNNEAAFPYRSADTVGCDGGTKP